MRIWRKLSLALALSALLVAPASAQNVLTLVPLGYCQITSLSAATLVTPANCVRASFTATGSGTSLTASSVTGQILPGDPVTGTGVPTGTFIASQVSGTPNGAGVYLTNQATTSSAASLTSGGIPQSATQVAITAEAQAIRYRDDGVAPAAAVGMPLAVGVALNYTGTLSKLRLIEQTGSAKANLLFYR